METLSDLKNYILTNYGIPPHVDAEDELVYRAITFHRKFTEGVGFHDPGDMWAVQRHGHTCDYMRTQELEKAIDSGGSLLYWFFPEGA